MLTTTTARYPDVIVPITPGTDPAIIRADLSRHLARAGIDPREIKDVLAALDGAPSTHEWFAIIMNTVRVDVLDAAPVRTTVASRTGARRVRHVRIRDDVWHAALTLAHDEGHTLSDVIRSLLREWLREHGREVAP